MRGSSSGSMHAWSATCMHQQQRLAAGACLAPWHAGTHPRLMNQIVWLARVSAVVTSFFAMSWAVMRRPGMMW